jgi:ABC-type uncharacterized transport system permease subunit
MADHGDRPPDDWGDQVAKWTFISTVVLAVLYVGSSMVYVLLR